MAKMLLTIGHSTRPIEEFLDVLRAHGVTVLVDVRTVPGSRKNPQFGQAALRASLEQAGIGYLHMKDLGGLRKPRPDSPNAGWRNTSFRGYADHMQTDTFQTALDALLALDGRPAVMCAEAVPWRCHRNLIADAATARGVPVEHIYDRETAKSHQLARFARVEGTRVTYPEC